MSEVPYHDEAMMREELIMRGGKMTSEGDENRDAGVTITQTPEAYDLHIQVPREMQEKLRKAAELGLKMRLTQKPSLAELMELFLGWGFNGLRNIWGQKMGIDR